jgi:hypothetical protein
MRSLALYLKAFLDRYIYFVPIIMLLATLVTNFVEYRGDTYNYVVIGNTIGYSLIINVPLWYFFNFKGKYCWFTRNAPIGLFIVNITDIVGYYMNDQLYHFLFNIVVCSIITILALVFYIKKRLSL